MRMRWVVLGLVGIAAVGIAVAYSLDAALPDEHRLKPVAVRANPGVVLMPTGTVDYAEFGYPGYSTGAPELRVTSEFVLPLAGEREPPRIVSVAAAELFKPKRDSIAWIWLIVAGALCALPLLAGTYAWRRRPTASTGLTAES